MTATERSTSVTANVWSNTRKILSRSERLVFTENCPASANVVRNSLSSAAPSAPGCRYTAAESAPCFPHSRA